MDVILLLILTVIFWGTAPIFDKAALKGGDPLLGTILRGMFIGLVMMLFGLFSGKFRELPLMPARSIFFFFLSGIFAGTLGVFTYFKALQLGPTSRIVPLAATYPLFTALLSVIVLGESVTLPRVIGIVLITAGVLLVK